MALIARFYETSSDQKSLHGPVECGWRAFTVDGLDVLQLDTYGSGERKLQGKTSQTIQLDRNAAEELLKILAAAFPGLRSPR